MRLNPTSLPPSDTLQLLSDDPRSDFVRNRPGIQENAIDKYCRSAGDVRAIPLSHVPLDLLDVPVGRKALSECASLKTKSISFLFELLDTQTILFREQQIVHFPELALIVRTQRRRSSVQGIRMPLRHGKLPVNDAQVRPESLNQPFKRGLKLLAERTLEIGNSTSVTGAFS